MSTSSVVNSKITGSPRVSAILTGVKRYFFAFTRMTRSVCATT